MNEHDAYEPFTGIQLYRRSDGSLGSTMWQNGMTIELEPSEEDHARPLGFYDLNKNSVLTPTVPD